MAQLKRQLTEKDASFALEIDALRLASDMYKLEEDRDGRWARLAAEEACDAMQVERDRALAEIASLQKTAANQDAHIIQLGERCRIETVRADALSIERGRHFEKRQGLETALSNVRAQYHDAKQANQQLKKSL